MTDREMLELAARACGKQHLLLYPDRYGYAEQWNPLTNDGDALRLAVKMNITVHPGFVYTPTGRLIDYRDYANRIGATRLAIVRAAAEVGREMK